MSNNIRVRQVQLMDLAHLHQLILESTSGKSLITKEKLHEDLFEILQPKCVRKKIIDLQYNLNNNSEATSNVSACNALVAELDDGKVVGYLLYNYFYTPWKGRCVNFIDLFTSPGHRLKGVAKHLVKNLMELCKKGGFSKFVFNMNSLSKELREYVEGYKPEMLRDEHSDWNVYRVEFKNI